MSFLKPHQVADALGVTTSVLRMRCFRGSVGLSARFLIWGSIVYVWWRTHSDSRILKQETQRNKKSLPFVDFRNQKAKKNGTHY